jgi:hypothetical protein
VTVRRGPVDRRVQALSDEDREALIRGEAFPSKRPRRTRLVRGVSSEADVLFTVLERSEGGRSLRFLARETRLVTFLSAAIAEL